MKVYLSIVLFEILLVVVLQSYYLFKYYRRVEHIDIVLEVINSIVTYSLLILYCFTIILIPILIYMFYKDRK